MSLHYRQSPYTTFIDQIKLYYSTQKRDFSWREHITPYRIVVSEIMLQQTQVNRVAQKFDEFIEAFPSFQALAQAPFYDVLRVWKGLGYNRRALALHKIAMIVVDQYDGQLSAEPEILEIFPGIGKATARSIVTFAFNKPTVFIETNIRTVFIYHFFKNQKNVHDNDIEPLVSATVDYANPREWYYALMDYGTMLKKTVGNVSVLSRHHHQQSKFEGSERQLRGMILQHLLDNKQLSVQQLVQLTGQCETRVTKLIKDLYGEGLIECQGNVVTIGNV